MTILLSQNNSRNYDYVKNSFSVILKVETSPFLLLYLVHGVNKKECLQQFFLFSFGSHWRLNTAKPTSNFARHFFPTILRKALGNTASDTIDTFLYYSPKYFNISTENLAHSFPFIHHIRSLSIRHSIDGILENSRNYFWNVSYIINRNSMEN